MVEKTQELAAPTNPSDPTDFLTQYQALLADLGPAFSAARDAVAGLDAPPIDNGDELKSQMLTLLDKSSTAFNSIADEIAQLDPADPNALQSLGSAIAGLAPDLKSSSDALNTAFSDPDMKDAFNEAPQCEGLDMGS